MKIYVNANFRIILEARKKVDGVRSLMETIEREFSNSPLASCCELQFISAGYNMFRHSAAIMYWLVPTDDRAYNVLKLKWTAKDWEDALDTFWATQIDDSIEPDHFGVLVDMEE